MRRMDLQIGKIERGQNGMEIFNSKDLAEDIEFLKMAVKNLESTITDLEKKAKKLGFSRREYEEIIDKQGAYDEAVEMNLYYNTLSKERNANLWSEAKMGEDPEPVSGKKTFTKKPQSKVTINPEEKI